jgi:uncharacterized protein
MAIVDGKAARRSFLGVAGLVIFYLLFSPLAIAGDDADCSASDELLKTDPGRAFAACSRLAAQGDVVAQYNLGLMYLTGQGVPQDDRQAATWFRAAAEKGDAPAQYYLGLSYQSGRGMKRDAVEAAMWYRKAAEQGYVYAQSVLGFMYGNGEGVPTDFVEAFLWLSLAAAAGDGDASDYRDFMAKGMAPEQVTEARRRLSQWKPNKMGDIQQGY